MKLRTNLDTILKGNVKGRSKIKGDASLAMLSVSSLALGYLVLNIFSTSANITGDVCSTLFGSTSILTLTKADVCLCIVISLIVVAVFIVFYNRIFSVTFDEEFAKSSGLRTEFYNLLIAIVIAVIIVLAMNLVGSLLISALIIFPALSAMRVMSTFKSVVLYSAFLSVVCSLLGMLISILCSTPVGATIVAVNLCAFFFNVIISFLLKLQ